VLGNFMMALAFRLPLHLSLLATLWAGGITIMGDHCQCAVFSKPRLQRAIRDVHEAMALLSPMGTLLAAARAATDLNRCRVIHVFAVVSVSLLAAYLQEPWGTASEMECWRPSGQGGVVARLQGVLGALSSRAVHFLRWLRGKGPPREVWDRAHRVRDWREGSAGIVARWWLLLSFTWATSLVIVLVAAG
jgi:hypothetical protein